MERAILAMVILLIAGCAWSSARALLAFTAHDDAWAVYFAVVSFVAGVSAVRVLALPGGDD